MQDEDSWRSHDGTCAHCGVRQLDLPTARCRHDDAHEKQHGRAPAPSEVTTTSWNGITMPLTAIPYDRGEEMPGHRLRFQYKHNSSRAWADKGGIEAWIYARAVRNIQRRVGVTADGVYGPETSRALGMDWDADVDYG